MDKVAEMISFYTCVKEQYIEVLIGFKLNWARLFPVSMLS